MVCKIILKKPVRGTSLGTRRAGLDVILQPGEYRLIHMDRSALGRWDEAIAWLQVAADTPIIQVRWRIGAFFLQRRPV